MLTTSTTRLIARKPPTPPFKIVGAYITWITISYASCAMITASTLANNETAIAVAYGLSIPVHSQPHQHLVTTADYLQITVVMFGGGAGLLTELMSEMLPGESTTKICVSMLVAWGVAAGAVTWFATSFDLRLWTWILLDVDSPGRGGIRWSTTL